MDERLRILGIRHHGPGSAALLRQALEALDPACVLIEGPPEADPLIPYAAAPGMKLPLAILIYAAGDANRALFAPFAEFSPEWQAMLWALERDRPVRFIDWPAAVALAPAEQRDQEDPGDQRTAGARPDPLDALAEAAGYDDGETFWNALIEQHGGTGQQALAVFAVVEEAMTALRDYQDRSGVIDEAERVREARREAFMRTHIRQALKDYHGTIAVVVGGWHVSALRTAIKVGEDRALIAGLPRIRVEVTWVPWTDGRLSRASGYGAGVLSPGWYRHLWTLYAREKVPEPAQFAAIWQASTAETLRRAGYWVPTAAAIEAARLAVSLAALRGASVPGLAEMRDAALAALCHGDETALGLIEQKLYQGECVGEIDESVPLMPLARDLARWQKRTRLKPESLETTISLDLRSEAGLLKSTLLHRLTLLRVPWGTLLEAEAGRGTFRELWLLRWEPELAVALAEALIYGVTIEQAAAGATLARAQQSTAITDLAGLVRAALVADLPDAATACIERLQAAAVHASDVTALMLAAAPLVHVLRYGTARKLPGEALRALITALSVEVNAGVRLGSHHLDQEAARQRVQAMQAYDQALTLFGDAALLDVWHRQLGLMVDDDQVAQAVAGVSLRRLHDLELWVMSAVSAAFSRHLGGQPPQRAGAFLESFLGGGAEVLLQDQPLLDLLDHWLCDLDEEDFMASLPLLRRSFSGFDSTARRRLRVRIAQGPQESPSPEPAAEQAGFAAFEQALPLLHQILGLQPP